jgi:hypothetical protein
MIQGTGAHSEEHFVGAGLGVWDIDILQNFGSAMLAEEDGLHGDSRLF